MWLDDADGFAEIFRGYLPFYLLVAVPIFILVSPTLPVAASHEFSVYRMQQYDLHTVPHGCRSASFNLEGRSLKSWSTSRHCVVARIQDITVEQFMEIRSKAGALLLVLPRNNTLLTLEEKEQIQLVEMVMGYQEVNIPVYFVPWSLEMEDILSDLQHSFITDDKSNTALEAIFNTVSSNGYQIVVSAPTPQKIDSKPVSVYGKLAGRSGAAQTIVIAANYDSTTIAPELPSGGCGAGAAAALLELARVFSRLYASGAARGAASLLFLLTPTSHQLNYFSTKKWLEEQLDSNDASLLQEVSFVMCLECLCGEGEGLHAHVSKPPRAGGAAHALLARLRAPLTHKKINLADELLAWHHERFSIRRMTAFTLTTLQSHKDVSRGCGAGGEGGAGGAARVARVARALAAHLYNLTDAEHTPEHLDKELYDQVLSVDEDYIKHWHKYLSSQPRSPHIITAPGAGVTSALERALSRATDTQRAQHAPDARDPEYALYSPTRATLYVYSVKPAVFDLILTLGIVAYLALVYGALQLFPRFYDEYAAIVTGKAKVQ